MFELRLNTRSDYKIWIVSDLHLGHGKPFIIGPRKYGSVQEALTHTFDEIARLVGPNDVLINLGDAVCGAGLTTSSLASRVVHIPCKAHYYIWGNHNAGMQSLYDDARREKGLLADNIEMYPLTIPGTNFTFIGDIAKLFVDGRMSVLCHYPIASWESIGKDSFMIHGHCHRNMKDEPTLKRVDVSWDWKRRPVEWSEIVTELANRKYVPVDHHAAEIK